MADETPNEPAPEPAPPDDRADRWADLTRLEAWLSRGVAVVGLGALVVFILVSDDRTAPVSVPLALIGCFMVAKAVVLVLGLRLRWPFSAAVAMELGAFVAVGWAVLQRSANVAVVLLIAVLLAGAALWRRRPMGASK